MKNISSELKKFEKEKQNLKLKRQKRKSKNSLFLRKIKEEKEKGTLKHVTVKKRPFFWRIKNSLLYFLFKIGLYR